MSGLRERSGSVAVIGTACVDLFLPGVHQWPPQSGIGTVVPNDPEFRAGGDAYNVAAGVAKLGGRPKIVTGVGSGGHGRFVQAAMEHAGIELPERCIFQGQRSALRIYVTDELDEPSYMHFGGAARNVGPEMLRALHGEGFFDDAVAIHLAGIGMLRSLEDEAFANALCDVLAQVACLEVSLDVNLTSGFDRLRWLATLEPLLATGLVATFAPNYAESCQIAGLPRYATIPETWPRDFRDALSQELCVDLGRTAIVVRDGEHGARVLGSDGQLAQVPALAVDSVRDLSGAGDAWWAGYLTRRAEQLSQGRYERDTTAISDATRWGHAAAHHAIQSFGACAWDVDLTMLRKQIDLSWS